MEGRGGSGGEERRGEEERGEERRGKNGRREMKEGKSEAEAAVKARARGR
jgi:hypothetical protein